MLQAKQIKAVGAVLFFSVFFSGCAKEIDVTVDDGSVSTQLRVSEGDTVEEILADAGISIAAEDRVTPDRKEEIGEEGAKITISRYARVTVIYGEEKAEVECVGGTVSDAIAESGFAVGENDTVSEEADSPLQDKMTIEIRHMRRVTLKADGGQRECVTEAVTVAGLLEEEGITLGENDKVKPKPEKELKDGAVVVVKRVEIREETVTEPVPYETKTTYTQDMKSGEKKVSVEGADGEKEVVYEVTYVDGKESGRKALSEKEIKEPVTEEILCGTRKKDTKPKDDGIPKVGDKKGRKTVTSRQVVEDCDGSGHGYYIITYDDGTEEYIDF